MQNASFFVITNKQTKPNTMKKFLQFKASVFLVCMMLLYIQNSYGQCYSTPNYCTAITAANNANYGMGIQRVNLGTSVTPNQINNVTTAGQGTQIYFDYTKIPDHSHNVGYLSLHQKFSINLYIQKLY